ncbi:MFS transporter [Streptomyces tsukubensis]|uniref:Major facilitator superfamily (MFS) profile domain-containing protein n=1 Tax=Streptomyces tsukubensis TaxID=83656 RepID=A0A1V4A417_9ACTN|nr:MFS transporter [Streptomyces tsukubensis]OON75178.1 hypothetical protein B1H18_23815 [Streptomyces tsukubensis]QFR96075.1 DHA2 family efflux MFS transporter permease subunit [Streptomyces tsukubensis]
MTVRPDPTTASNSRERLVLLLSCLSAFAVILDGTIVSVALPDIDSDLKFSAATLPWVVNAYTLAFAGLLLLGGRCADAFGVKFTLATGLALFGLAGLAGGVASTPAMLLAARAAQGIGGALMLPTTLAALAQTFGEGPRRASAMATWSMVGSSGAIAGTVIGGLLTQFLGWRWVFIINVPITVAAGLLAAFALHEQDTVRSRPRLDIMGALLVTTALSAIVYAVMDSSERGWGDPIIWGSATGGITLLGLFIAHQYHVASQPLVPLTIFRSRSLSSANTTVFALSLAFLSTPVLLSLYVQTVNHFSPLEASFTLLPSALALMVGGRIAGKVTVRLGTRRASVLGIAIGTLGFTLLAFSLEEQGPLLLKVVLPTILIGFGVGSAFTPLTMAATRGVEPAHRGVAAGLFNATRQTSGAVGLAVTSAVAAAVTASAARSAGTATPTMTSLAHGYTVAFGVAACCSLAAGVMAALTMPHDSPVRTESNEYVSS